MGLLPKKKILYRDQGKTPYLIRWTIFKCRWFSIKLHKTLLSDTADLHDHPWSYISLILWGGYGEVIGVRRAYSTLHDNNRSRLKEVYTWYKPGCMLFRRADQPHRLIIPENKYAITLIFTSYKWRNWGFATTEGWIPHEQGVDKY